VYNSNSNFIVSKSYIVQGIGLIISGVMKSGTIKKGDTLYLGPNSEGFIRDENNVIIEKSKLNMSCKSSDNNSNDNSQSYYKVVVKNIHNNFKESVDCLYAGQSGCFNIKSSNKIIIKRTMLKQGMRLLSVINSVREFDAKIKILHNPSTITKKYQPTINCEGVSQSVQIIDMDKEYLRSYDEAIVRFKFMYKPEYLECGALFLFREGLTKGIGKIINVY
jgi:GTPase